MIAPPPLQIAIRPAQSIESVLRHGLRFRMRVDLKVTVAFSARMTCGGQDSGLVERPVHKARMHPGVRVQNIGVRRVMRKAQAITCRLDVVTYDKHLRDPIAVRHAHVTLR